MSQRDPRASRARLHARCFVAIHAPPSIAGSLLDGLDALPGLRRSAIDDVFLTLLYIGDLDRRHSISVRESVGRACSGFHRFDLRFEAIETFPRDAPARLVAAVTDAPSPLLEIQRRLVQRLARTQKSKGEFAPRFTLGRFPAPTSLDLRQPVAGDLSFTVRRVALLESFVSTDGTDHAELAAFELP
ncbi:MAG: 2'-5' RNA ligase family protein [Planctomycetes bacterium]|nr:2'-5' RNA ligase family protein [Planctomycetota bacterium]